MILSVAKVVIKDGHLGDKLDPEVPCMFYLEALLPHFGMQGFVRVLSQAMQKLERTSKSRTNPVYTSMTNPIPMCDL